MVEPSNGPAAGYCLIWLLLFTGRREVGERDGERGRRETGYLVYTDFLVYTNFLVYTGFLSFTGFLV